MTSFLPVRALGRGIRLLTLVAEMGREATLARLAAASGLPKATVLRLLDTLVVEGFLTRVGERGPYLMTERVRRLAEGVDPDALLLAVAEPPMERLRARIGWPSDLAVFDGRTMLIRSTNRPRTPLLVNRDLVGYRPPLMLSAVGRVYLAFLDESERRTLFERLGIRSSERIDATLRETRKRGWGVRDDSLDPPTGAIAVPVVARGRVVAALSVVYITQAARLEEILAKCLGPLQHAAEEIGRQL